MKFSWNNFDVMFIHDVIKSSDLPSETKEIADYCYGENDKDGLVSVINSICTYPDKKFITDYRVLIEQEVLKFNRTEVTKICKALNINGSTHNERQANMTKKVLSTSLIQAYISALESISGINVSLDASSKFRMTVSLNMRETQTEEVPLYDFQKDAIIKLKEHFVTNDKDNGILVMPTGSGKSRTAISFLVEEMIGRGYQILWIAHRDMLLDQAAEVFYNFAGLSKINNPGIRNYRISCISNEHLNIKSVDNHEIIIASIASICKNKDHLRRILNNKVMVVVDECHHTLAPTYQDTIKFIKKCRKNSKLLGLTATPIRSNDDDSCRLLKLFDNTIVYNANLSDLIVNGTLATPKFHNVQTGEYFEPEISIDEEKLIRKYGELPETLVSKIANSNFRNSIILEEYLQHAKEYGKTLIFALNILHCRFLYKELSKNGVRCDLVYSGKDDNSKVIKRFKDGLVDVLVNVNIMTEGTDVPDIQTVFLTRPTSSESLLMQMIGRGMRGRAAGGTETVNIINFQDEWEVFNKWINPKWIIDNEIDDKEPEELVSKRVEYIEYEWSLCREIYKGIRFSAQKAGCIVCLPSGWFTLIDANGDLKRMLIFENQLSGIKQLMMDKKLWIDDENFNASVALKRYFSGFCTNPSIDDLALLIDNIRTLEDTPHMYPFVNRMCADPYYVMKKANASNQDIFELGSQIYDENDTVKDLYKDKESYIMELCKAKVYEGKVPVVGLKVEELPDKLIPYDRTPVYDINTLVQEVKDERFDGRFDGISDVMWTDKAYRGYYGIHYALDHSIKINCVLNSKDVPREVVKFVIYHELLHRDNMTHNADFRSEEHKYPNYCNCEHFLYDNMTHFDIKGW